MKINQCLYLFALLPITACGNDALCGIETDSLGVLMTSIGENDIAWSRWQSSPNNDCGEMGGPTSLTVEAKQEGSAHQITICLPRPDKLSDTPESVTDKSRIRIIDIFARVERNNIECLASLDRSKEASGTIAFPGLCNHNTFAEGYSMDLDLQIPMSVTCGNETQSETMTLKALVAVQAL